MAESEFEIIRKTSNYSEAGMICELLKSEGIDCVILDKNAAGITGGLAISFRVAVPSEQKEKAFEILKSFK